MSVRLHLNSEWELLHAVRLQGNAEGAKEAEVESLLDVGFVTRRGAAVVITPAGREAHAEWALLVAGSEARMAAEEAYARFLELDKQVKQVTTDWQLASSPRLEGFSVEDWALIDRLIAVDSKAGPVVSRLGSLVPRFASYRARLRNAITRLEEGDRKWFSGLTCDSYHMVWWQLHEELLIALGIARSDDPNQ